MRPGHCLICGASVYRCVGNGTKIVIDLRPNPVLEGRFLITEEGKAVRVGDGAVIHSSVARFEEHRCSAM